jgi:hypothetical protein
LRPSSSRSLPAPGLFVTAASTFASALLFVCLLGCLVAMASFSNSHRACRDACTTTSPALGPGGAATKEVAVNTDSNARFGGEVEWNVSGKTDFFGSPVSN